MLYSRGMTNTPQLAEYDLVLVNSSAGKDSQAMLDEIVRIADAQGYAREQLVVVHADLGRVEWQGTRELAAEQAAHYGLRFEIVQRDGDLLDQVLDRKLARPDAPSWPSSAARYCTSDQKTHQVFKLMRVLVDERAHLGRQVRILNCLGIRAQESAARAKKQAFGFDKPASNGKRHVDRWLPIFDWSESEVWARIAESGVRYHEAYDAGMPRLSCCFCVLSGRRELVLSARLNPELAQEYLAVEQLVESDFKQGLSMAQIIAEAAADEAAMSAG